MDIKQKNIAILGSTGSIGTQALEVIAANPESLKVEVLSANNTPPLLIEQAIEHQPNAVVIVNEEKYKVGEEALSPHHIKVYAGQEALAQIVESDGIVMLLPALV